MFAFSRPILTDYRARVIGQWVRTQDFRELKTEIAQDMT